MLIRLWQGVTAACLLVIATALNAAVPPGISGSWFNPAQGGHGLSVQVLGDGRAIAYWFVYDTQGKPLHLYIDGTVSGRTITGPAYRHDGMRFGSFDPAAVVQTLWGHVTLSFDSCASGGLAYTADGPGGAGFGDGAMALTRLSQLAGTECRLGLVDALPVGLYDTSITSREANRTFTMSGAVDPDGQIWATDPSGTSTRFFPTSTFVPVLDGYATARSAATATASFRVLNNAALNDGQARASLVAATFDVTGGGATAPLRAPGGVLVDGGSMRYSAARTPQIRGDFRLDDLVGRRYYVTLRSQFVDDYALVSFDAQGNLCLSQVNLVAPCTWIGKVTVPYPGWRFFDVHLKRGDDPPYVGRGWIEYENGSPARVVVVANDGVRGLGFVATEESAR